MRISAARAMPASVRVKGLHSIICEQYEAKLQSNCYKAYSRDGVPSRVIPPIFVSDALEIIIHLPPMTVRSTHRETESHRTHHLPSPMTTYSIAKSPKGPPLRLKHVFTAGSCANDAQPSGPTRTAKSRPELLGCETAAELNRIGAKKHWSNGTDARLIESTVPLQLKPEKRRRLAGKSACATSVWTPFAPTVMFGLGATLVMSTTGKSVAIDGSTRSAPMGRAAGAMGLAKAACAKSAATTAVRAKNIFEEWLVDCSSECVLDECVADRSCSTVVFIAVSGRQWWTVTTSRWLLDVGSMLLVPCSALLDLGGTVSGMSYKGEGTGMRLPTTVRESDDGPTRTLYWASRDLQGLRPDRRSHILARSSS